MRKICLAANWHGLGVRGGTWWVPGPYAAQLLCCAGQLAAFGYTLVPDEQREAAALWLINSCTVKSPSQSQLDNVISAGRKLGKHLVVAGCVPQGGILPPASQTASCSCGVGTTCSPDGFGATGQLNVEG